MGEKANERIGDREKDAVARFQEELDKLRSEISRLREDMQETMSGVVEVGRQGVGAAKARAAEELDARMKQLEDAYARARQHGTKAMDSLEKQIEERPLVVVAAAVAAGALLGRLLMGPREK